MSLLLRQRKILLIVALLATVGLGAVAPMIPMSADVTEFLPQDVPEGKFWLAMTNRFGALDLVMIGLEEPDEPLQISSIQSLDRVTRGLAALKGDGVLLARSLTNLDNIHEDELGTIQTDLLVNKLPENEEERWKLAARIDGNTQAPGSFVSHDLRAYVIIVRMDPTRDSRDLASKIREVVESQRGELIPYYFGAPFIENTITSQVYSQIPLVGGLFVVLLLLPIFILARRVGGALLIVGCAGVSLVWWLGLLQLLQIELTATASGAALVLLSLGALINARLAQQWYESGTISFSPIFPAALIAALALFLLSFFPLPFLAHFGQVASIGMLTVPLSSALLFLPALSFLTRKLPPGTGPTAHNIKPAFALAVVVLLLAGGIYAAQRNRFLLNPRDIFTTQDDVGRATAFFDRYMGGNDVLQISLKGDFREVEDCARLMRLTDLLQREYLFSDVRSVTQILGMLGEEFGGIHRIPSHRGALQNLWFFLEGNPDIAPLISDDRSEAMLAARIQPNSDVSAGDVVAIARRVVKASADVSPASAVLRLSAIPVHAGMRLQPGAVTELVEQLLAPVSPTEEAQRRKVLLGELHEYMVSDDSPFEPTKEEWERIAAALGQTDEEEKLLEAITSAEGFKEMEYPPEVAASVVATLDSRYKSGLHRFRLEPIIGTLRNMVGSLPGTASFLARARGILVDLLEPPPRADDMQITVSGFPAVIPLVTEKVRTDLWLAALLLWGVMLLGMIAVLRSPPLVARVGIEALLVAVLTFGFGWLLRIQIDSASSVLYLLPPLAAFFCSPALSGPHIDGSPLSGNRLAPAIAASLGAAALSLLVIGIMPVFRIGATMAVGLAIVASIAPLSRRVRSEKP